MGQRARRREAGNTGVTRGRNPDERVTRSPGPMIGVSDGPRPSDAGLMTSLTLLLCWWKARNEMIFNNNQFSIQDCREFFFKELCLVSFRVKQSLSVPFDLWIQNL